MWKYFVSQINFPENITTYINLKRMVAWFSKQSTSSLNVASPTDTTQNGYIYIYIDIDIYKHIYSLMAGYTNFCAAKR